jgi:hypothetical protein
VGIWADVDADCYATAYWDVAMIARFFQFAYSSAPAMANNTINQGSKYAFTMRDKDGELLDAPAPTSYICQGAFPRSSTVAEE